MERKNKYYIGILKRIVLRWRKKKLKINYFETEE